jgi:cysteine synthase A
MTGCEILGKAEFMNPGQSVKDRAALFIIREALAKGELQPGGTIVEGTAGNTGIGLALVGASMGFKTVIVIPETQSQEKKDMLRLAGADLVQVPAAPYRNLNNYVRYSGRLAQELAQSLPHGAIWANQFDNTANRQSHVETTGPEIWEQTQGRVDGFVCAVGTGGTIAGVAEALQPKGVKIGLADPEGSALHSGYTDGKFEMPGNSITEGIGQSRITGNLEGFRPDLSWRIPDSEALPIVFDLLEHEGALPRRLLRHQRRGRDPHGAGHGPRPYHRDDPLRLRHPLPVQALEPRVPARQGPPRAELARPRARLDPGRLRGLMRVLLLVALLLGLAGPAAAQDAGGPSPAEAPAADGLDYSAWFATASRAESLSEAGRGSDFALGRLRLDLVGWRNLFAAELAANAARIATVEEQLAALGEAPADGAPPEDERVAERRSQLLADLARLRAPSLLAQEAYAHADGLIGEIDAMTRSRTASALLTRSRPPLDPRLWPDLADAMASRGVGLWKEVTTSVRSEARRATLARDWPLAALFLVVGVTALLRGRGWLEAAARAVRARPAPSPLRGRHGANVVALVLSLVQALLPLLGIAALAWSVGRPASSARAPSPSPGPRRWPRPASWRPAGSRSSSSRPPARTRRPSTSARRC